MGATAFQFRPYFLLYAAWKQARLSHVGGLIHPLNVLEGVVWNAEFACALACAMCSGPQPLPSSKGYAWKAIRTCDTNHSKARWRRRD